MASPLQAAQIACAKAFCVQPDALPSTLIEFFSPTEGSVIGGTSVPTETKVESGTSQSKSGTSVNLSNSGNFGTLLPPAKKGTAH